MRVVAGDFGKGPIIIQRPGSHSAKGAPVSLIFLRLKGGTEIVSVSKIEMVWTGRIRFSDWPGSSIAAVSQTLDENCTAELFLRDRRKVLIRGNHQQIVEVQTQAELFSLLRL
jgi:hypothetical protein